ncbi:NADH-quinone oxidoreductase subunit J [Seonamhaeicola sp.]|uniref:NADH-quinone oxidoreductase subunit J family protein n=1 Tax=Seonamhaeicola sp. TaxID=1912245 RepID=UPI002613FE4C|nr:NADH-quinone oxidoreductase subunit J [Seonamhaeicola sp.]
MERIIFYILALTMIVFAMAAVRSRKMLRSVIFLLFVLAGIAGIFFLIDYNFLAAVQLTVYAGGIIVLIIFSVLLVHHIELELEVAKPLKQVITGIACLLGIGVVLNTIYTHDFKVVENDLTTSTADIGSKLLSVEAGGFILPFEVISVVLLAAMIGAIIIAKGKKLEKGSSETEDRSQINTGSNEI